MIICIDPGPLGSGWVVLDGMTIVDHGNTSNVQLLAMLRSWERWEDYCAIEHIRSYQLLVGNSLVDTAIASGRLAEAYPGPTYMVPRADVRKYCRVPAKGSDPAIRQFLIDRWGGPHNLLKGGALYGIVKHAWSALAVGVTFQDALNRGAIPYAKW